MAKKTTTSSLSWSQICDQAKQHKFAPIYLLYGAESYYIDLIAQTIVDNAISEDERDFNYTSFYGLDSNVRDIIADCRRAPMMSEYNVVEIKEAQMLNEIDLLQHYFRNPVPTTILIISYKKENFTATETAKIAKASSNVITFNSQPIRDYNLPSVIIEHAKAEGLTMPQESAMIIADFIGSDISKIVSDIKKLSIVMKGQGTVTPEIIEKNIGISKSFNNLELLDAVLKRDLAKGMRILDYYEKNPKASSGVLIIGTLIGAFTKILIAGTNQGKSPSELAAMMGASPYATEKMYLPATRKYSNRAVFQIIQLIRDCDRKIKGVTSRANEYDALKELFMRILV